MRRKKKAISLRERLERGKIVNAAIETAIADAWRKRSRGNIFGPRLTKDREKRIRRSVIEKIAGERGISTRELDDDLAFIELMASVRTCCTPQFAEMVLASSMLHERLRHHLVRFRLFIREVSDLVSERSQLNGAGDTIEEQDGGVSVIALKDQNTAFAFVGDTDMVVCVGSKSLDDINSAIAARAGRKRSIVKSATAGLEAIPAEARGIVIGALPEHSRRVLATSPLEAAPKKVVLSVVDAQEASKTVVRFQATMQDAEEANTFAAGAEGLKKQGFDALGRVPVGALKPESLKVLTETLRRITIRVEGTSVHCSSTVSPELGAIIIERAGFRQVAPVTDPPRKQGIP